MLAKEPLVQIKIRKRDGSWNQTNSETLELLINTHFPGCVGAGPEDCVVTELRTKTAPISKAERQAVAEEIVGVDKVA